MTEADDHPPGFSALASRIVRNGVGALQNRAELFALEWREERLRFVGLLIVGGLLSFLVVMGVLMLTLTVILLFPEEQRLYAAGVFGVFYLLGAVGAWFGLRTMLKREPFAETINQVKKDRLWLEALK